MDIQITVVDIKGHCPVYRKGDTFYLKDGYVLDPKQSGRVCMHSLASIMPYYVAIGRGVEPYELGLAQVGGKPARVQCLDPCEYTGGGTVVFEMTKVEHDGNSKTN
jgi:uncharacterized repeat protein (TIGR04076 family)